MEPQATVKVSQAHALSFALGSVNEYRTSAPQELQWLC
jgi:hypothetical protein